MKQLGEKFDDDNDIGESDDRSSAARSLKQNASDQVVLPDLSPWRGNVSAVKSSPNSAKMRVVGEDDFGVKSSSGSRQHNMLAFNVSLALFISIVMYK